jgi:serine/threonine protein kinase
MGGSPFQPGDLVAEWFRIVAEVGRGGMGVVYEAFDERLNRRVALKSAREGFRHWLPPEVRAAREVSHFNVCKVHDLHSTGGAWPDVEFLTMEFIEGETLSERIRREGPLEPAAARKIGRQICAGLAAAHRQGVIHGDLKCANILLTKTPSGAARAVITDFGLAAIEQAGEQRTINRVAGSLDYMAPELFRSEPISVASDLYAVGIILHYMLTGEAPPPMGQPRMPVVERTITMAHSAVGPYVPRQAGALPAPWYAIVSRCLEPDPADRFRSAEEVADSLRDDRRTAGTLRQIAGLLWGRFDPSRLVRRASL